MEDYRPLRVDKPLQTMSPESYAEWMSYTASSEFLTPERLAFLKKMSTNLAEDPALLKVIERIFAEFGDDIRRISPSDAELESTSFGWGGDGGQALIPPAAAAAALAPPAAAMAAAHVPSE